MLTLAVIVRHELSRAAEPHLHSRTLLINAALVARARQRGKAPAAATPTAIAAASPSAPSTRTVGC